MLKVPGHSETRQMAQVARERRRAEASWVRRGLRERVKTDDRADPAQENQQHKAHLG